MAAYYQSNLGISFAVLALGAGVVGAVNQVLTSQVSAPVARLTLRSRPFWLGVALSLIAACIATAGALLLAGPHDILPGVWGINALIANPATGLACIASLGSGAALILTGGIRSLRLLDLESAADAVGQLEDLRHLAGWAIGRRAGLELIYEDLGPALEGLDVEYMAAGFYLFEANRADTEPTGGSADEAQLAHRLWVRKQDRARDVSQLRRGIERRTLTDPLEPLAELLDAAALRGRPAVVESIARRWLAKPPELPATGLWSLSRVEAETLIAKVVFDDHLDQLARRWSDRGDSEALAAVSRAAAAAGPEGSDGWLEASLVFSMRVSQMLLSRASSGPLCSVIRDLSSFATTALERDGGALERIHDEVCRALGRLGQQVPVVFRDPSDPDVYLVPDALRFDHADPLGCLLDALDG